jgi:sugar lactone lactonase YvrE
MTKKRTITVKKFTARAAIAVLIAPTVVAAGATSAFGVTNEGRIAGVAITDVRTVATFDYAAGGQPESVTLNPEGSMTVSLLGFLNGQPPQLLRISSSGRRAVLVTGGPGEAIGGNVRGRDGTIYYNMLSADPSRSGIWRLAPGGTPERIGALPAGQFLNGLTMDAGSRTLYAADSLTGTIWTVPTSGGPVTAWLVSPALAPAQPGPGHFGANGVEFHDGAVWVSNTDRETLLRVPVTATGAPGPVKVIAGNLAGIDDFKFLSDCSDVAFVALNGQDEVAVVYPDGRSKVVLTAADGLDSPTDTAVRGTRIFITDSGNAAPHDAKLQSGKIDIAALLADADTP